MTKMYLQRYNYMILYKAHEAIVFINHVIVSLKNVNIFIKHA